MHAPAAYASLSKTVATILGATVLRFFYSFLLNGKKVNKSKKAFLHDNKVGPTGFEPVTYAL